MAHHLEGRHVDVVYREFGGESISVAHRKRATLNLDKVDIWAIASGLTGDLRANFPTPRAPVTLFHVGLDDAITTGIFVVSVLVVLLRNDEILSCKTA